MSMMIRAVGLLWFVALAVYGQKQPFTVQALMEVKRISEPQLSPDGSMVAFTVQEVDLEKNLRPQNIYTVPVRGGESRRITWSGTANHRPRWSPDSGRIAFISNRSGSSQVWIMDAAGGNPRQVTDLATEADGVLFSPDGDTLIFTSEVYPECGADDACNRARLEAERASPVKARIYEALLYRHWDRWKTARRRHILAVSLSSGRLRDLTPGDLEAPPFALGGPDDYAISPDGKELCYVAKPDPNPATHTNTELFVVPIEGGSPVRLTNAPGADNSPAYSPDGNYLAWRGQMRAGYESDRWRLTLMKRKPALEPPAEGGPEWDTSSITFLAEALDRPVTSLTWSPDSTRLFFTVEDRGRSAIHTIAVTGGATRLVASGSSTLGDQQLTPDGKTMIYTVQSGSRPVEIWAAASAGGTPVQLTRLNDALLERHHLSPFEEFRVEGAQQTPVYSFLVKPANFREGQRYPALFLIHGGPQSAWMESWHYRWNAQVFAGAGYVVVLPNPRGSTGFGQRFTDEINADWGGKVYEDIMAVVDHVARLPYVDPDRLAAAGGSFGGYMINWMMGHTQRFRALVSHAGVFDLPSKTLETEELWFPLWEFQGMPWDNPELYRKWSPSQYVRDFFTPTLVIHGELDFRVPYGQGLQLFTALQMQGVPSKLLLFPDEGHWILKPRNSVLWYETFLEWIDRWTKKPR